VLIRFIDSIPSLSSIREAGGNHLTTPTPYEGTGEPDSHALPAESIFPIDRNHLIETDVESIDGAIVSDKPVAVEPLDDFLFHSDPVVSKISRP
jgi:hypothetical protein